MEDELSEDDVSVKFITPAVVKAGWDEATQIRRQVSFTKGRIIDYGVRFTRPVLVDATTGADVTVETKVGSVMDDAVRFDLTVTFGGETVLGKAQVQVVFD